jgi:uncharacterized membrane protein YjfL (UPF0719 family)
MILFGSISWHRVWDSFPALIQFSQLFTDFQLFGLSTTEETYIKICIVFSQFVYRISNFFGSSTTDETSLVEMRIWCIKIGIVLVLRFTFKAILKSLSEDITCEM